MKNDDIALTILKDWQAEDPGARKFQISYVGEVKTTSLTWSKGYSVRLSSTRIKRSDHHTRLWYPGQTLLSAAQNALNAYARSVR